VRDPDPHAVDAGHVLGIKFDVFSRAQRTFAAPYYVFLVRVEQGVDEWRVHKHTVPAMVPVRALARKHLPSGGVDASMDDTVAERGRKQDIGAFSRAVRKELVGMVRRKDALLMVERVCKENGVTEFEITDGTGREVQVTTQYGLKVRFRMDIAGEAVEKVVIRVAGQTGLEGRRQDLERDCMQDGGNLDRLLSIITTSRPA
jgi:central kinetochore subunit Mal2/MCM21